MSHSPDTPPTAEDCLTAPVQYAGAIQAHGYLVSCSRSDWTIRHVSENLGGLLGVPTESLPGMPLQEFVEADVLQRISDAVAAAGVDTAQRVCTANIGALMTVCDVTAHAAQDLLHIELEPQPRDAGRLPPTALAQRMISGLDVAGDWPGFFGAVARQVHELTGYDRVMVYRFREDDSGEVIAEVHADGMEPYLGLRYPATDIPPPARRLYLRNRIRIIPDASYTPVPVLPATTGDEPLDMSQHVLRSVAPVHLEYLRNMGVAASMSISIISGGRLWGLVACHHRSPRRVPAATRVAADLFGMFVSMRVAAREQELAVERFDRAQQLRDALVLRLASAGDFDLALSGELAQARGVLECDGAMLRLGDRWHQDGLVPTGEQASLLGWAAAGEGAPVPHTDAVADWEGPGLDARGLAGVLAIPLGAPGEWLFLFRCEQAGQVHWAGEPHKAMVPTDDGVRLAPRRSFALWKEEVRGRSRPWSRADLHGAERLHQILREQRSRARARGAELAELEDRYQRRRLQEQKARLDGVSSLLAGLVDVEVADVERLERQIGRLEGELRGLIRQSARARGKPADAPPA